MSIKVRRATGMMGGATKVALEVDHQVVTKLKNNEEYTIPCEGEKVTIKAKQMFFGSEEKQVERGDIVEIKINNNALLLLVVSVMAMLFGDMISPTIILMGLIGAVVTIVYSTKKWFDLEVKSKEQSIN
ncbi:hypothetical protein COE51_15215 [Bacillus pseudomycoides]|nr:hypothetical protein COE51_15215 [Bacillus pseudomycoides]